MPTNKPRVQVTLEPSTHEVIERLAELQGRTRGSVIAELLDAVAPSLSRTVALIEAAKEAPESVRKGLIQVVQGAHDDLLEVVGDAHKQVDLLGEEMGKLGAPVREANPHVVTRGSGRGVKKPKTTKKTSQTKTLAKKSKGGRNG